MSGVPSDQGLGRDIEHPGAAMAGFLVGTQGTVLLLEPVVSVPMGVLARTLWEQLGGWQDLSVVPGFRDSQRC